MKTLLMITLLTLLPCGALAQEIYKWEDEKGVIHYDDKPNQPAAKPLEKDVVPYSNTGDLPPESPAEKKIRLRSEREEERASDEGRQPRPSPSLGRPKAWLNHNGRLQLSGTIRNSGKGMCESPVVEVTVLDESGSVDGNFATAAFPNEIARGEEARFEGEYLTPVGDFLSWDALPRCDSSDGVVYGAYKRGTVSLKRHRTLRLKQFKIQ
jgi:Domain of unknown function (DUF4124)